MGLVMTTFINATDLVFSFYPVYVKVQIKTRAPKISSYGSSDFIEDNDFLQMVLKRFFLRGFNFILKPCHAMSCVHYVLCSF